MINMARKNTIDQHALDTTVCPVCDSTTTPAIAQREWLRGDGIHFCGAECKDLFWDDAELHANPEMWNKCSCTLCVQQHDHIAIFGIAPPTGGVPHEYPTHVGKCFHSPRPCIICEKRGSPYIPRADELVRKELIGDIHFIHTLDMEPDQHNAAVAKAILRAPRPHGYPVFFFLLDNPEPCPECGTFLSSPSAWWKDGDYSCVCFGGHP